MSLRCITCDIPLEQSSANALNEPVPEFKSFVMVKIYEDCLQMEVTGNYVICDGCKVQLILFYQFKLKVVALQLRRLEENKKVEEIVKEKTENDLNNHQDESHFDCDEISQEDNAQENSSNEYNCMHCSATFVVDSALEVHILGVHSTSSSLFTCIDCNEKFQSDQDLQKHKNDIHVSKTFVCHICGNRFNKATKLRFHIKTKHDLKKAVRSRTESQVVACDVCQKILSNRSALRRHKTSVHKIGRKNLPYHCQICDTRWPTKHTLESHHLTKHTTERNFKCAVCEKNFVTKQNLVSHINRIHCSTKDFICHTCGKSFKSRTYLNTHYLVHSQKKAFTCDDCGVSFKQEATLYTHKKMHREKQAGVIYDCQICQRTFISARTLKKHQMTHTGPDLECDQCGKTYKQKDSLTKHIFSVHKRLKVRVMCRLCNKTLWNRKRMREHVVEEHSEVLESNPGKKADDYLEKSQIFDQTKRKRKRTRTVDNIELQVISVQILNHNE